MSKQVIKLTESDLHRIVKESVNKILSEAINELDPRTYASYADKRRAQGTINNLVLTILVMVKMVHSIKLDIIWAAMITMLLMQNKM